jgi:elongator complex protein 3
LNQAMAHPNENYPLYREIIEELLNSEEVLDRSVINKVKHRLCAKFRKSKVPSNADILAAAVPEEAELLKPFLQKRPVRTVSGVAVVAVMTEPHPCPHGKCAYCPGGPEAGVPQSYTGHEPATMRGLQHDFDPFRQVQSRLHQLNTIGHSTQKIELIVMGGDWCSKERKYRESFVKGCLDAMNGEDSKSLEEAKLRNETSMNRNVGMTFETRPDWISTDSINEMLEMGATRVEIGVQSLSDSILERVQRGHGVAATKKATKLLRDSGLKICYHMMPGLPGSSPERDIKEFVQLFDDSAYRPDMFKIYPTIVVKNTQLYDWWRAGEYTPYTNDQIIDLVAQAVSRMPEYVRIQRMQRDIPLHQIEAGLSKGNLRELVHEKMQSEGWRNPTIRYREIGHYEIRTGTTIEPEEFQLVRREYEASNGTEYFLSFEEPNLDVILAFLRLRKPSVDAHRPEINEQSCVIIRELRVYGSVVDIGKRDPAAWQHLGFGEKLIHAAEEIGRDELGMSRILVNSGIGVKPYYRDLGFHDFGPFLVKNL